MKLRHSSVVKAQAEIRRLETILGIEDSGKRYLNIMAAHRRIEELEAMVAKLPTAPEPLSVILSKALTPLGGGVAAEELPAGLTRPKLMQILTVCDRNAAHQVQDFWTDSELFFECERAAYQSHVEFPGRRSDSELAEEFWRSERVGSVRVTAAEKQNSINKIIKI
jgi:hypothetical protein